MSTTDKAGEARKGLLDSVAGKAKEVAGAVTGKDDLAREGQLQQAGAQARKDASTSEALADAEARQTTDELGRRNDHVTERKQQAYADAGRREDAVAHDAAAAKQAAEVDARRREEADQRHAEHAADALVDQGAADAAQLEADASSSARTAAAQQRRLVDEAAAAEREAARLRAETTE